MDEGNLDNQNQSEQEQDNVSMLDKIIQNNPLMVNRPLEYENARSQSVVQSTREEANAQLAELNARNEEIIRQQKAAEQARKTKRTIAAIIAIIIVAAIAVASIWIIINIITANQRVAKTDGVSGAGSESQSGEVGDYKCNSADCRKVADTTVENTIIIRDGKNYYLYDTVKKQSSLTAIPEGEYDIVKPFVWGEIDYVVVGSSTSGSALFSLTENRQITNFVYDTFYTNLESDHYQDMQWVAGQYIVAKSYGSYRLLSVNDGTELLNATKRVFIKDNYFYGYETDGSIHIYSNGSQIYFAQQDTSIYSNGEQIIVIKDGDYTVYERNGEESENEEIEDFLDEHDDDLEAALGQNPQYYRIEPNV